jgi:hypothetical protein
MAELTSSTREAARRLGVSDTTMHKAERTGRIAREPDGQWDIAKTRSRLLETADPQRSALAGSAAAEGTPFARLKVAQLALKVEAQRLALDESKGRLLDVATANATMGTEAGNNWLGHILRHFLAPVRPYRHPPDLGRNEALSCPRLTPFGHKKLKNSELNRC